LVSRADHELEAIFAELTASAAAVVRRGTVLVAEDEDGSHHAVAVEVPMEVVGRLAAAVKDARALLRSGLRDAA
jgi:hypothetical protein